MSVVESQRAKNIVESQHAKNIVETQRGEVIVETQRVENIVETQLVENMAETQQVENTTVETHLVENRVETQVVDNIVETQRYDKNFLKKPRGYDEDFLAWLHCFEGTPSHSVLAEGWNLHAQQHLGDFTWPIFWYKWRFCVATEYLHDFMPEYLERHLSFKKQVEPFA